MQNLVGEKFNKLTVVEFSHKAPGGIYWKCECECGNTNTVTQSALKRGATKSCGCSRKKEKSESLQKLYTRTWRSWEMMHQRCCNTEFPSYVNYGAKGISICDRWNRHKGGSFFNFLEDMGERPENMSIERLDVNGDYTPENCVWDSRTVQSYNRNRFSNNTSGRTGVIQTKSGAWAAYIDMNGERDNLGTFVDYEDAVSVREEAELIYYGQNKM